MAFICNFVIVKTGINFFLIKEKIMMKNIISLLISISFLFPYTALSYSYHAETQEVEAENIQNIENTQALILGTVILLIGPIGSMGVQSVRLVNNLYDILEKDERIKNLENTLELACDKLRNEVENCKKQVSQMSNADLMKIEEILLKAKNVTI